jgi:hypothetical protein
VRDREGLPRATVAGESLLVCVQGVESPTQLQFCGGGFCIEWGAGLLLESCAKPARYAGHMKLPCSTSTALAFFAAWSLWPVQAAAAQEQAKQPPVKVYVMLGQSNMVGFGRIDPVETPGTLANLAQQKHELVAGMQDAEGNWLARDDVWLVQVTVGQKQQWLQPSGRHFGPELGFGQVIGDFHEEPVVLIKASQGNRSLGWDILPPDSERFVFDGRTYAGSGDTTPSWIEGEEKQPVNWYAGKQYDDFLRDTQEVLADLKKFYPYDQGQGFEIAGFVWWQGHKDQNPAHASRYEQNLVHLIKQLRKDLKAPTAKFVMATIAFEGWQLKGPGLTVAEAQLAVSGERGKYPEFVGNVKTVEARGAWRAKEASPTGQGHHYNHNAETYLWVGRALGEAMVELLRPPVRVDATESKR